MVASLLRMEKTGDEWFVAEEVSGEVQEDIF